MRDSTFISLMKVFPKSALSSAVGLLTRAPAPAGLHRIAMKAFARRYRVELAEAEHGLEGYRTFSEFFSRGFRPGQRPIDAGEKVLVSPVDGAVSQIGQAVDGQCVQAKGISYPLEKLLGDPAVARDFADGSFATLYLSPRDYHRIHAPLSGKILGYSYLPGQFWPVNPASVRNVDALFCVNERLITLIQTAAGLCAVIKVGATCVSRIRASYEPIVTHTGQPARVHRFESPIPVEKGAELGAFEMGSTVILLFQRGRIRWDPELREESVVRMGKRMGVLL